MKPTTLLWRKDHQNHLVKVLVAGDAPPCHWSQTRVTTTRVNDLWCGAPAVAVLDGIACCLPHLPSERLAAKVAEMRSEEARL
jgi:hypothetical protein